MQVKVARETITAGVRDQLELPGWTLENGDELAPWFYVTPADLPDTPLYISLPDAARARLLAGERQGIQRHYCPALMRKAMRLYKMELEPPAFSLQYILYTDEEGRLFYAPLHIMEPGQQMPDKDGPLRVLVGREPLARGWYDPDEGTRLKKGLPNE